MNYLKERNYLLMEAICIVFSFQSLYRRSGILVLVNDTDWEVLDKENTPVENGDNILFLSTLHGG